jgi:hypothetical protein
MREIGRTLTSTRGGGFSGLGKKMAKRWMDELEIIKGDLGGEIGKTGQTCVYLGHSLQCQSFQTLIYGK